MKKFYRMKIVKTELAYVTVETDDPSKFTESDFTMEELYEAFDYSDWDLYHRSLMMTDWRSGAPRAPMGLLA